MSMTRKGLCRTTSTSSLSLSWSRATGWVWRTSKFVNISFLISLSCKYHVFLGSLLLRGVRT